MPLELQRPTPQWVDGLNEITMPGGPFPSAWRYLLAAATSSPAALRAALATYAIMLEAEGLTRLRMKALETRRLIDLRAPDPKAEQLTSLLADGAPTLVVTEYAATVLYLRDRLIDLSPAWCTKCLAGWRHAFFPRERVFEWFRKGAPDIAPWILIARSPADPAELGRVTRVVRYDSMGIERS